MTAIAIIREESLGTLALAEDVHHGQRPFTLFFFRSSLLSILLVLCLDGLFLAYRCVMPTFVAFDHAQARTVEDSSPLISYAPAGAWTDSPRDDTLLAVRFAWDLTTNC